MRYGIAPPGFRLPEKTHVGAVHLQVSDLERSLDYYQQVLGLRVRTPTSDSAVLGAPGDDRPLVWLQARSGVQPAPRRGAFGLYHFAILLPERAALGRFAAHLFRLGMRPGMADHLVSEALYLTDPDGLGIEVYADRPRSAWTQNDRELAMTTEPLDIRNLIAAGDERPWDGVPAATTMGHVHLHVGSLHEAEAFYHVGLGFDKTVWSYPGALFFSAGGYHHHLATNTWSPGPSATDDQARLLEWELVVPGSEDASTAARSLRAGGYAADDSSDSWTSKDPWGTRLRIVTTSTPARG
jgi:catechol 2,3-dioxygenase